MRVVWCSSARRVRRNWASCANGRDARFVLAFRRRSVLRPAPHELGHDQRENPRAIGDRNIVDPNVASILGTTEANSDGRLSAAVDAHRDGRGGVSLRKNRAVTQVELELDGSNERRRADR